jgi:hypothetical protein
MDHPKRLATQGQGTALFGCARGFRRGRYCWSNCHTWSFFYKKRLKAGHFVICEVHVFPLKVSRQTKQWPERRQREVKWVSAKEAADAVQEPKLSAIIRHLARRSAE